MSWKLPVLICVIGLGGLTLLGVVALHLLGNAGISVSLYSIQVSPEPIGIVICVLIGLVGLVTYLTLRKPRSTPKL